MLLRSKVVKDDGPWRYETSRDARHIKGCSFVGKPEREHVCHWLSGTLPPNPMPSPFAFDPPPSHPFSTSHPTRNTPLRPCLTVSDLSELSSARLVTRSRREGQWETMSPIVSRCRVGFPVDPPFPGVRLAPSLAPLLSPRRLTRDQDRNALAHALVLVLALAVRSLSNDPLSS